MDHKSSARWRARCTVTANSAVCTMSKPLNERQLTEAQVEELQGVRVFEGMNPDQFRYLVRRVEFEHRIGDSMELEEAGIARLKDRG